MQRFEFHIGSTFDISPVVIPFYLYCGSFPNRGGTTLAASPKLFSRSHILLTSTLDRSTQANVSLSHSLAPVSAEAKTTGHHGNNRPVNLPS